MPPKTVKPAQNPLILRSHRLMEAFAKSDDERDFLLDRAEGFILFIDLDKPQADLDILRKEVTQSTDRYVLIPKLTFYETKKIMEGFVNEKVYDIDTKEKLLEIISSKEARENFLEFIYDHHSEMEKWQQYYIERSRIRIIEWLRTVEFEFVFEEDLDMPRELIEKVKLNLFEAKVPKDVDHARKALQIKAKTYYSNEALNPRPKRGRPPKQVQKTEVEKEVSTDIYTTVPADVRPFLFTPEFSTSHTSTFSTRFESEDALLNRKKKTAENDPQSTVDALNLKLSELRSLSSRWLKTEVPLLEVKKELSEMEQEEVEIFRESSRDAKKEKVVLNHKSKPAPVIKKVLPVKPDVKSASKKAAPPVPAKKKKPLKKIIPKKGPLPPPKKRK